MEKNQLKTAIFLVTTTDQQLGSGVPLNTRREIFRIKATNLTAGADLLTLCRVQQDAGLLTVNAAAAHKKVTVTDTTPFFVGQLVYIGDSTDGVETNTIASIDSNNNILTMTTNLANTYNTANGAIVEEILSYDEFTLQNEVATDPEELTEKPLYTIEGGGTVDAPTSYLTAHMTSGTSYLTIWYVDNED